MAKNTGLFKLSGTLDDATFSQTEHGNIVGLKPGPSRERVLTDEKFDKTRRNAAEFKMAVQDSARLRYSLGRALNGMTGSSLNGRMNGLLYSIAQDDQSNDYGSRRFCNGDISVLNGFDFNKRLPLAAVRGLKLEHSLDATTGIFKLEVPSFIARKRNVYPAAATHFRIVSGGAAINFIHPRRAADNQDIQTSELLPLGKKTPGTICFEHQVQVREGEVLVQVLGVEFYKLVNGHEVLVKGSVLQVVEAVGRCGHFKTESQRGS